MFPGLYQQKLSSVLGLRYLPTVQDTQLISYDLWYQRLNLGLKGLKDLTRAVPVYVVL